MCDDQKEAFPKLFSCPTLGFESPRVFQIFGSRQGLRSKPFPNWVIFKPCWKGLENYYNTTKLSTKSNSLGVSLVSFNIINTKLVMWNENFTKITKYETSLCTKFGAKANLVPYSTSLLCVCQGDSVNFLLQVFFLFKNFLFLCKHKGIIAWKCVNRDKWKPCDILVKSF
jgi:hypothetical protein